ncbi:hypothetical protein [Mesorhizobium sp. KR1-2]|uniref:hypothetical protein n=1 Tax=Mesorhizobium sp. KR1-2 TaxID=3156609 RepID=UPI0032B4E890
MRKFLFAITAVLLGSGAALADSAPPTVIVNPKHIVFETYANAPVTGDTAPSVKIVKQPRLDYRSAAAIQAPHYGVLYNSRGGDAAPPLR